MVLIQIFKADSTVCVSLFSVQVSARSCRILLRDGEHGVYRLTLEDRLCYILWPEAQTVGKDKNIDKAQFEGRGQREEAA